MEYAIEYSLFIFLRKIYTKNETLSWHANLNGFQTHCHILKELYEVLVYNGGCVISIIFGEGSLRYIYIFNFIYLFIWVSYG
jgi:hypothetical protein